MPRFLIAGSIQAQGFGLEPEPKRLIVEASTLDRACAVVRSLHPDFELSQGRLARLSEPLGAHFREV
jgi:hypothetical protein